MKMKKNKKQIRIYNHILPKSQKLNKVLDKIFGMGFRSSNLFIKSLGYANNTKVVDLLESDIILIRKKLNKYSFCLEKKKKDRLKKILKHYETNKSIKGFRLKNGLPVRGQRTKSNAKTAKKLKKNF